MTDTESYPLHPGFKARETSAAAAEAVAPKAPTLRLQCLAVFERNPAGLTADEVAGALAKSVLTIRPRVAELARLGRIEDSGARRRNESGHNAVVWQVRHG